MSGPEFLSQQELATGNNEFNQLEFMVRMMLGRINVATLVQVQAVNPTPNNSAQAVGTVDVLPLVGQVDGSGKVWPATTIYGLPYFRLQAGAAAVLVDPQPGDIGLVVFCDRDISSVKATAGASGPGSARRFDLADGVYLGGWMSQVVPTSYVQVSSQQIEMNFQGITTVMNSSGITHTVGGDSIVLTSGQCTINATTKINGTLEVTGNATFDANASVTGNLGAGGEVTGNGGSHTLSQHTHGGVQAGSSTTQKPTG